MEFRSGGLLFTSKFDSGNLSRVERVLGDEEEGSGTHRVGDPCITPDFEFNVWTNPDCAGTEFENGNRTWFHFAIKGCPQNRLIKINVINLNKQGKLYNQGMSPVVKVLPQKPKWERIRDKPTHETVNGQFTMSFTYRFEYRFSMVYFAFCYPYSYAEYQNRLEELDIKFQDSRKLSPNSPHNSIYYHRELLCYSRDHLRVDLMTISSCHGLTNEEEPRLNRLFPDLITPRAKRFKHKRVFFLSSRVHPGETPASFVFNGFLDFILRPNDPRAVQLRKQYVFKLIPLLNPDGVQRGHYRTDQRGVNLNRMYLNPDPELHPSIFAAKSLILYHHLHNKVKSQQQVLYAPTPVPQNTPRPKTAGHNQKTVSVQLSTKNFAITDQDDFTEQISRKPTAIVMVHGDADMVFSDGTAGGDATMTSTDTSGHFGNGTPLQSQAGLPDGFEENHDLNRDHSVDGESDGEDGDLCQKTSQLTLADSISPTPIAHCFKQEDLLSVPPNESGIAFYVDLHGHASKRGCFIYGNHLPIVEEQVENLLYPKLVAMNSAYFDFDGCNFSEKNMYTKDKKDGMSKEGSGRVAIHKATGIIHSYTLECNYNTGRFMNSLGPATMDDGRASPPPLAGFPPKYTIAHYEEVGRAVAVAALDMTDTNPWSRLASTEYISVHGVRGWVQRYLRSMKGAPKLPNKMSRVASKTSSIVASATSHAGMHSKARQALSDTSSQPSTSGHPRLRQTTSDAGAQSTVHPRLRQTISDTGGHSGGVHPRLRQTTSDTGNQAKSRLLVGDTAVQQSSNQLRNGTHSNNNSNRKMPISRHLGPVRETRASIERKKRLAQLHQHHNNHPQANQHKPRSTNHSPSSSYTVNTPAPCNSSSHSPINLTFNSGINQTKPLGQQGVGGGQQSKGGATAHANNSNNHGSNVKALNSKLQPASHRMPPKGTKKVIEELINHMVVNSLDALKNTNVDAETTREPRPLGQTAGEAKLTNTQRLFHSTNKKRVGGARGDESSNASKGSPKRVAKKGVNFKRRSLSHSPSRKGVQGRKSSETDSDGEFRNMRRKTIPTTLAVGGVPQGSVSSPAAKGHHSEREQQQMSPRRWSTGRSTPDGTYLRPHMEQITKAASLTSRSLSPSASAISCQLLDLHTIASTKPVKNTNYWNEK